MDKLEIEKFKDDLCKKLIKEVYPKQITGGQTCGMPSTGIKLRCEYTEFEISVNHYRSQIKNLDLGLLLYRLFLDETIK